MNKNKKKKKNVSDEVPLLSELSGKMCKTDKVSRLGSVPAESPLSIICDRKCSLMIE